MLHLLIWLSSQASGQDTNIVVAQNVANIQRCIFIVPRETLKLDQRDRLEAMAELKPGPFSKNRKQRQEAYYAARQETGVALAEAYTVIALINVQLQQLEDTIRRGQPDVELTPLTLDECLILIMTDQGSVNPQRKT